MVHVVDSTLVFARRPVAEKQLFAGQMVCPKLSIRAGQIGLKNRPDRPRCFPDASHFGRGTAWQFTAHLKVVEQCHQNQMDCE
jgi:hypothetical protein